MAAPLFCRVSEEQIGRIQQRRARIKSLLDELGESLRLVQNLHKSSEVCHLHSICVDCLSCAFFSISPYLVVFVLAVLGDDGV